MSFKPSTVPHLVRGKFISAIDGFSDAWNWLIDSAFNFSVGDGLKLTWDDDRPKIELDEGEEEEEAPVETGAFAYNDGVVSNCHFMLGRTGPVYTLTDRAISDGTWYLVIYHTEPNLSEITTTPQTGLDYTSVLLFSVSGGKITADYRGMPIVPMWDAEASS